MINRTVVSAMILVSSGQAIAHPGNHDHVPVGKLASHITSSPFHTVLSLFAIAAVTAVAVRAFRARRSK